MTLQDKYIDYLDRMEKNNKEYKAFRTLCSRDEVLKSLEDRKDSFLLVLADIISTKGIKTTANSKMLENYIPAFDATIVKD